MKREADGEKESHKEGEEEEGNCGERRRGKKRELQAGRSGGRWAKLDNGGKKGGGTKGKRKGGETSPSLPLWGASRGEEPKFFFKVPPLI